MLRHSVGLVFGVTVFLSGCRSPDELPISFVSIGAESVLTLIGQGKYEHHLNGLSVGLVDLKQHEKSLNEEKFTFEVLPSSPQKMTAGHVFKLKSVGYANSPVPIPLTAIYMCEGCNTNKTYLDLAYTKIMSKSK